MPEIVLEGFDELARALDKAQELFVPLASRAIALSLEAIQEEIETVPPQPDRNRAKTFNTWVREVGRLPKAAFVTVGGQIKVKGKATSYHISRASERLPFSFRTTVKASREEIVGHLLNDASYSGWVLGPSDEGETPHQVPWHAQTGWVSEDDAITAAIPQIESSLDEAVQDLLEILAGA